MPETTPQNVTPGIREPAIDTRRKRVGEVMDKAGSTCWIRPLGGGREWEASLKDVRPPTQDELLSAKVALTNHRSTHPC